MYKPKVLKQKYDFYKSEQAMELQNYLSWNMT